MSVRSALPISLLKFDPADLWHDQSQTQTCAWYSYDSTHEEMLSVTDKICENRASTWQNEVPKKRVATSDHDPLNIVNDVMRKMTFYVRGPLQNVPGLGDLSLVGPSTALGLDYDVARYGDYITYRTAGAYAFLQVANTTFVVGFAGADFTHPTLQSHGVYGKDYPYPAASQFVTDLLKGIVGKLSPIVHQAESGHQAVNSNNGQTPGITLARPPSDTWQPSQPYIC